MPFADLNLPAREQPESYTQEPEVHLRAYWFVILKRRWVIAAVTLVVLSLTVGNALFRRPVYTARALLQINRGRINVVKGSVSPESWFGSQEFYPTQKRVLESFTLAERVVDELRLWEHPRFRIGDGSDPDADQLEALAGTVLSMLDVTHIRNSQLMEITFTTPEPELSGKLANSLVAQYITFSARTEIQLARETTSFFSEQIEKLHGEIQEKEDLIREYTRSEDILLFDQNESMVVQQLRELNQQLSRVRGKRAAAEARYRNLRIADPGALEEVVRNPNIQKLENQQASLQDHYEELSAKFAPDWPELRRTEDALQKVALRLERETQETGEQVVEASRVEYLSVLDAERLLQNAVEEQKQEAQSLNHRRLRSYQGRARQQEGHVGTTPAQAVRDRGERGIGRRAGREQSPGRKGLGPQGTFRLHGA